MLNYVFYNQYRLNESYGGKGNGNENEIKELGTVKIYNFEKEVFEDADVFPIINVVKKALGTIERHFPYLYQFVGKCAVMYIPQFPCKQITDTMCVDTNNNLWINMTYVASICKMDDKRVFGILFHELFHIVLDHLVRHRQEYPDDVMKDAPDTVKKNAMTKSNICMDYEVNSSMVEDGIVSDDFWKKMNGLYKPKYTGMRYEEILHQYGDAEFNEYMERNGEKMSELEKKILEAIEKATKILFDPSSTDKDKEKARKELKKTIDKLLGRKKEGVQKTLEDMKNSKLGEIGKAKEYMDELIDDLDKPVSKMSDDEFRKTLDDVDELLTDMYNNSKEISKTFGKNDETTKKDIEKCAKKFRKNLKKMKEGGLTKDEKQDLMDEIKDALEDTIASESDKKKREKERAERDKAKEEKRKEEAKKKHPVNKVIIIIDNLLGLEDYGLICDETIGNLSIIYDKLVSLLDIDIEKITESDLDGIMNDFSDLKESFFKDLKKLLDDKVILRKSEDDMHELLDKVFNNIQEGFDKLIDETASAEAKSGGMSLVAHKLRVIGKILKTQKQWRVGDDFKNAYKSECRRLIDMLKKDGEKALFKYLFENGYIDTMSLDDHAKKLLQDMIKSGEIKR